MKVAMRSVSSATVFTIHHIVVLAFSVAWWVVVLGTTAIFVSGLLFSWLYLRYRSVWVVWLCHAIADVVGSVVQLVGRVHGTDALRRIFHVADIGDVLGKGDVAGLGQLGIVPVFDRLRDLVEKKGGDGRGHRHHQED